MDCMEEVIAALRQAKDQAGETNKSVSGKSGVPISSVAKFFSGALTNPSFFMVGSIAEALGVSLDELAGISSTEPEPDLAMQSRLEAAEQELLLTKRYAIRLESGLDERKPVIYGLVGLCIFLALAFGAYVVMDIRDTEHGLIRGGSTVSPLLYLLLIAIISTGLVTAHHIAKRSAKQKEGQSDGLH